MRRVFVAVVLCAAVFVAACSDDAPHDANATDAARRPAAHRARRRRVQQ